MNKMYFVVTLLVLTLTSCQKKEKLGSDSENEIEAVQVTDSMTKNDASTDSLAVNSDKDGVKSLDKMSTKTETIITDPSEGKFSLSETKWKLIELDGKKVDDKSKEIFYINLDSKSARFAAFAGCNNISGAYTMKDTGMLAFSKIMSTKMSCPNTDFEGKFMKALEKVDNYTIEDNSLHFKKGKRNHMAKFIAIK